MEGEEELVAELKTELATVVEVLCVLHDFIDNLFGVKFQTFCESNSQLASQVGVLKDLRWKHLGDCIPRRSTSSSGGKSTEREGSRLQLIGSPEIVDVKCEAEGEEEVPDFLEDVDPFGGDGEVSSKNYQDQHHHYLSGYEGMEQEMSPYQVSTITGENASNSLSTTGNTSNRYTSEFIMVENEKDPLQETVVDEEDSVSSDDSDDWNPRMEDPTSAFFGSRKKQLQKNQKTPSAPAPRGRPKRVEKDKGFLQQQFTIQIQPQLKRQSSTDSSKGDGGPFKCDQCPASYSQEESLRSHQKYKHNPSRVQCTCHLCGKSMVDKYRLQRHLRLHTGEKPFSCQYCGQRFYRKDYHTKHLQRKHGLVNSAPSSSSTTSKSALKKALLAKTPPEPSKSAGGAGSSSKSSGSSFITPSRSSTSTSSTHHQQPSSTQSAASSTAVKQEHGFLDYFSNNPNSTSSLVTMTSLTFDDLINEDL
ncbi:Gastrula zinc finger protein XlCGF26.1 [Orchesella cincta]|uniref:Gastrula zinc finger protein XlCGF26.1 n=1 Tax=Orchesella cincta TaxID=48709 RepID=A0A1D2MD59_ORCCI|nr:Gastrula zinc finger protein XlCGF26.1 [Orchesella cincta]